MATNSARNATSSPSALSASRSTPLRGIPGGRDGTSGSDRQALYTAGSFRRIVAYAIDVSIVWVAAWMIGEDTPHQLLFDFGVYFSIQFLMVALLGQTPGTRLTGLHVVDNRKFNPDGGKYPDVSWFSAAVRSVVLPISCASWLLVMSAVLNPRRRTFHDWISGTRVVQTFPRTRPPGRRVLLFLFPVILPFAVFTLVLSPRLIWSWITSPRQGATTIFDPSVPRPRIDAAKWKGERIELNETEFRAMNAKGIREHMQSALVVPTSASGTPAGSYSGAQLQNIKPGSIWEFMKFRNNDVIVGMTGYTEVGSGQVFALPTLLETNRSVQLTLIRSEARIDVEYHFSN